MARKMNLYNETDVDIEKLRQSVVNELNREEDWLMILDNVDDVDLVKTILPERRGNRHVLITTRDRDMCEELFAKEIHLDVMSNIEAKRLLLKIYPARETVDADAQRRCLRARKRVKVSSFSYHTSGCLSSSDLRQNRKLYRTLSTFEDIYLELDASKRKIKDPKDRSYVSVVTTMVLAFEKIKQEELSIRLFCLLSFFSSNNIPQLLFTNDPRFQDEKLRQCFSGI